MSGPAKQAVNRVLEGQGRWLSNNATLTLVTLIVFLGITAGFVYALVRLDGEKRAGARATTGATRGPGSVASTCAHAAVEFKSDATAADIRQLLRAVDGYVSYGPDEFGRFQVRLADGATGAGMAGLRSSPVVSRLSAYPECP